MQDTKLPFTTETYKSRREKLMAKMQSGKIILLGNSNSSKNFADNYYQFRQDSSFLYYIGINQEGLNAVIDADEGKTILFGDDITMDHVIWMGEQESLKSLAAKSGIETVLPAHKIFDHCTRDMHYLPPYRAEHSLRLEQYLDLTELKPSVQLILAIAEQRNIKSEEEIEEMHLAASLTSKMHELIMRQAKAGMAEYELVALASKFAWENNVQWSFTPIMTVNGQTLHNHSYTNTLKRGDLLLYDGGIESPSGYAGDMTRTMPVSKSFTPLQKDIYQIVVNAHEAARLACKPKVYYKDIHLIACLEIAKGLTELGFMKSDPEDAVMDGAHSLFFQHGLGHLIGLDVHDMENLGESFVGYDETIRKSEEFGLKSLRLGRPLQVSYAITIEPGIYIIPSLIEQWRSENKHSEFIDYEKLNDILDFGGIRVENDYVIREEGAQLLGERLPYKTKELEAIRQAAY